MISNGFSTFTNNYYTSQHTNTLIDIIHFRYCINTLSNNECYMNLQYGIYSQSDLFPVNSPYKT